MLTPPNIHIQNVYLSNGKTVLFNNLSMVLAAGKWSCLLGPSGIGKSTLLKLIAQLISHHTAGKIFCDDDLALSKNIAYMGQTDLLLPWLTTLENALLSQRLQGSSLKTMKAKAEELLVQVGLKDALNKYPKELSGGMRQRVALVRTLIQNKPIVLMDEPFSGVDAITRFQLQALAANLLKQHTVLLITHDPMEALRLAHEIYILSGQPSVLNKHLILNTQTPRDPSDPELSPHQTELFQALIAAKEISE